MEPEIVEAIAIAIKVLSACIGIAIFLGIAFVLAKWFID